jgi:hypothetical protein
MWDPHADDAAHLADYNRSRIQRELEPRLAAIEQHLDEIDGRLRELEQFIRGLG